MIMRGVFLFCLSALAASTQAVVVKPPGVNDPDTDAWLGGIEVPSHKPAMLPGSSNNGSCAGQKPPLWPPDQKEDYDRDAKLDVTPNAKGGSNSQRIFKRDQIESFYCGPHRKNIPKQVIGYGYTRYQVEQAFQDAEVFLRFWEPQRGHDLRSTPYPQLLGVTGAVFANEPNVPEFCKDKNAYLYEYPILRGNTCDMKPLHFRDGAYAPGPDRVIMAADKKPSGSKQQNEDLFRTARIKACTVATFQNQIDADASSTANPQLTPCSLYKYNA